MGNSQACSQASVYIKGGLIRTVSKVSFQMYVSRICQVFELRMVLVAFFFFFFFKVSVSLKKWSHLAWDFDSPDCPPNSHCVFHCHGRMNVTAEQRHETHFAN